MISGQNPHCEVLVSSASAVPMRNRGGDPLHSLAEAKNHPNCTLMICIAEPWTGSDHSFFGKIDNRLDIRAHKEIRSLENQTRLK